MMGRLDLEIKIGLSGIENSWDRSLAAYNSSLKALDVADGSNGVTHSNEWDEKNAEGGVYPVETEKKFLDRVVAGDCESVHALFNSISLWFSERYPGDIAILKGKLYELLVLTRFHTQQIQPQYGGFAVWKDSLKQIESISEVRALELYVLSAIDECLGVINEHKQSRMSPLIIKACTIIHDNLSHEISLEELARRVEISPFYFSKLFKEETGENFIDYITMARMQKAKDLLRDHTLSIKEVSGSSGYSDPNYFSKLFKKIMGLTPTEYRLSN
jgi:two-component system response regulator YesN